LIRPIENAPAGEGWIWLPQDVLTNPERQRLLFARQPRQSPREMVSGESHYFMGRRYRLRVHDQQGAARVAIRGLRMLDLFVRPGATTEQREDVLLRWYREQLKALIPPCWRSGNR
jgi:predicted metal-dependent hydrolase